MATRSHIERDEFEARLAEFGKQQEVRFRELDDRVERGFAEAAERNDRILAKIERLGEGSRWTITQIGAAALGVIGLAGVPFALAVTTYVFAGENRAAIVSIREAMAADDENEADVRERLRASEVRHIEGETQHRAIGEELRLVRDYEHRMAGSYCVQCDRDGRTSRIHFDPPTAQPLTEIGKVPDAGVSR